MTTAPTPEEVRALAERLEHCVAKWGKQNALSLEAYSAVKMMRRMQASYQALQTENERLRMELVAEASAAAEQKLRADQLAQQHRMQAQMHAQATQQLAELEARKPLPLSYRAGAMTSSVDGGATVSLHFNDMAEAEAWFVAITDQHDTALTSKATGPLPGSTGGSS